jgi:hypothetical protein
LITLSFTLISFFTLTGRGKMATPVTPESQEVI